MRIIFNSDVLHLRSFTNGKLSKALKDLCAVCRRNGHILVLPTTTLLEMERWLAMEVEKERKAIQEAYDVLAKHGIAHDAVDPKVAIKAPDLLMIFRREGVKIEVAEPTFAEFQEANRRACLHLPPHPDESKSDEMRDLVIWMIAIRFARLENIAMLVSRDVVHTGLAAQDEAASCNLMILKGIDDAMNEVDRHTPLQKTALTLLWAIWPDLVNTDIPLPSSATDTSIDDVSFVQGEHGIAAARMSILTTNRSKPSVRSRLEFAIKPGRIEQVDVRKTSIDGVSMPQLDQTIKVDRSFVEVDDVTERLHALRTVIGGNI